MLNIKNSFAQNYRLTIKKPSNHSILTSEMRVREIFIRRSLVHYQTFINPRLYASEYMSIYMCCCANDNVLVVHNEDIVKVIVAYPYPYSLVI